MARFRAEEIFLWPNDRMLLNLLECYWVILFCTSDGNTCYCSEPITIGFIWNQTLREKLKLVQYIRTWWLKDKLLTSRVGSLKKTIERIWEICIKLLISKESFYMETLKTSFSQQTPVMVETNAGLLIKV